jgi:hypothetical protein
MAAIGENKQPDLEWKGPAKKLKTAVKKAFGLYEKETGEKVDSITVSDGLMIHIYHKKTGLIFQEGETNGGIE